MTTVCTDHDVRFPRDRRTQSADLGALAGDALLRGDHVAWFVLLEASNKLKHEPDHDTQEGKIRSLEVQAHVFRGLKS